MICEDKNLTTSVYRKPTFNGIYTNFQSFLLSCYKFGTAQRILYRFFRICSSWTKLCTEYTVLEIQLQSVSYTLAARICKNFLQNKSCR